MLSKLQNFNSRTLYRQSFIREKLSLFLSFSSKVSLARVLEKRVFWNDRIVSDSLSGLSDRSGEGAEEEEKKEKEGREGEMEQEVKQEAEEEVRSKEDGKRGGERGSSPELSTDGM